MKDNSGELDESATTGKLNRRGLFRAAALGAAIAPAPWLIGGVAQAASPASPERDVTSAESLPGLPKGFWKTFTSKFVTVDGLRLHAVTGGRGPALLLICGWPQTWYAWRHVMPTLARHFSVVAIEPRGVGLSDKPASGYDSGTLADEAVKVMKTLGHQRFALVTHDIGVWSGYALASDYPEAVARFAAMETLTPGLSDPGMLLLPGPRNTVFWHFPFNRVEGVNEQLVRGREEIYFGYQFATKGATPTSVPAEVVKVYVDALKSSPEALRSSFETYRAIDENIAQNAKRKQTKLRMPVLAVGGEHSANDTVAAEMRTVSDNVSSVVIPNCGHFVMDEKPEDVIAALTPFLAPYRR